ncbi:MAG: rRNA pseudouridine synthase [Clostridiales bacterium]|nr:rRNA pseudouridine synthase [Clostridiales bacterium]
MMIRLQKFLASCGVASRRNAEKMITEGRIAVNGVIVTELGTQVDGEHDAVTVDGLTVHPEEEKHYIAYNKPVGEVTTVSDPEGRATVLDRFRDYPVRLFPVGRLDYDSDGLLILTNDGDLMNRLLHPSFEIPKSYLTRVSNNVTDEEIRTLRKGVLIDGRMTSPAEVRLIRHDAFSTELLITIHEGRNRQVRKMVSAVGHQVVRLKRVRFGPVYLGDLPSGMWRKLTDEEITKLRP